MLFDFYHATVISANPLTQDLLGVEVHVEGNGPSEPEVAMQHLNTLWSLGITIDKFWGDGSFDVLDLFNLLERHGTEGKFSAVKRIFGEKTRSKTVGNMCLEVRRRFWAYERMRQYAKA